MNSECIYDVLFPVIGTECLAWVRARLNAKVNPSQRVEGAKRRGFLWGQHQQRGGGSAQSKDRHLLMRHGNLGRSRGKAASGRFRRIQKVEEEGKGKTPLPSVPVLTLVPNCFSRSPAVAHSSHSRVCGSLSTPGCLAPFCWLTRWSRHGRQPGDLAPE